MIDISRLPHTVPAVVRAFATPGGMRDLRPCCGAGRSGESHNSAHGRSPAELIGTLMRVLSDDPETGGSA